MLRHVARGSRSRTTDLPIDGRQSPCTVLCLHRYSFFHRFSFLLPGVIDLLWIVPFPPVPPRCRRCLTMFWWKIWDCSSWAFLCVRVQFFNLSSFPGNEQTLARKMLGSAGQCEFSLSLAWRSLHLPLCLCSRCQRRVLPVGRISSLCPVVLISSGASWLTLNGWSKLMFIWRMLISRSASLL